LRKQFQKLPSFDPHDDAYRRLHYVRYADDTKQTQKRRRINGRIALLVPPDVVESKGTPYQQNGKPIHRKLLLESDDFTIIEHYQQEYRGIVQDYMLAQNVSWFWKLHWLAKGSLLKTLANKHQTTIMKMLQKYEVSFQAADGTTYRCLEIQIQREEKKPLVARFGGIPLKRQKSAVLVDWKNATTMGQSHGSTPKKDPGGVSLLSSGYPCRSAHATEEIGLNERESRMR
jgi:hypothetical protein